MKKQFAALLLGLGLAVAPAGATVPEDGDIRFSVLREGDKPMGRHTLRFEQRGEELHVFIDIELEVKFAFFTAFEYQHRNHEVWVDGELRSISTMTNNDGDELFVEGRRTAEGFVVETRDGRTVLQAPVIPTSYWHPSTLSGGEMLNTQNGEVLNVEIGPQGSDVILVRGAQVETQHYRISGDLEVQLWYTPEKEWAKIAFTVKGTDVTYERQDAVELREARR